MLALAEVGSHGTCWEHEEGAWPSPRKLAEKWSRVRACTAGEGRASLSPRNFTHKRQAQRTHGRKIKPF